MKKSYFFMFFCFVIFSFTNEKAFSGNQHLSEKGTPQITSTPGRTVTITPPVGTTTLFCTGVPYQFGGNVIDTAGASVLWYQWSSASAVGVTIVNSACGTCNGPNITFANTGSYTLTLIVNMNTGLNDTATYALSVVQTPTIQTSPNILNVCQGGSVGTLIYVTGANAAGTYTWSPMANVSTTYAAGDSILINPPNTGVYTYTVVGTDAAGCLSAPVVVTATVNAPPVINAHATDDSICSYLNTSVHMDPSYPIVGTTYTWTAAANANLGTPYSQASAVSPIYSGNVDTTFVYYGNLTVPGCPAYPTYTVYVVVVPSPTVHVVSDTVENCNKKGDSLKVTSNPTTAVNFTWTPSVGLSATIGSGVFAHPLFPTTYYVTPSITVGSNVCVGKRDSVKVLIGDSMNAGINTQYLILCRGMKDTLIANPPRTQLNGTYQYYWTLPSVATGTTTSISNDTMVITPTAIGIYTLTVMGTCIKKHIAEVYIAVNANCATPIPSYSVTADTICRRKCVTFTDLTQYYTTNNNVRPLFYTWAFTVLPPQITIACIPPKCAITYSASTVHYAATDSSIIPKIKVCYYQNSALNGSFPITETVSHDPTFASLTAVATGSMTVYDGPSAVAGHSQTINLGDHAALSGLGSSGTLAGIAGYSWSPPSSLTCTNCATTSATPSVTTQYVLTVTDHNGCTDTSNVTVFVDIFCFDPFIPSAFSPNGDNENDILKVRSNCLTNFTFKVFDRWGEKVFETTDLNHGWDGSFRNEPMNAAVFVYTLEGYLSNGKEVKQKGNITLVK